MHAKIAYWFMTFLTFGLVLVCFLLLNHDFRIYTLESEVNSCYYLFREVKQVKEAQRIHERRADLHSLPESN